MPTAIKVVELEPLALSPVAASRHLSISERTLSRQIRTGKIEACNAGPRTLADVASMKAHRAGPPKKIGHAPTVRLPRSCPAVCASSVSSPMN
jgi:hypothetical protein